MIVTVWWWAWFRTYAFLACWSCLLGGEVVFCGTGGYRSGRTSDWLKFKNPAAPAVKREAEEDWA